MSSELEQRLERVLRGIEPASPTTEQAKAAALAAREGSGLRSRYRLALVAAALVGALVMTGVTLAASRTVREVVGITDTPPRATHHSRLPHSPLPPGSGGFAAFGNGRLWLASPSLAIADEPHSAAELSPGALNIAVGSGHALVVRRLSDGGVAWSHHTTGHVVAAAWAPIGTEIAYVVQSRGTAQLRMIEGDGDHDRLVAGSVSAVTPSWRADSLALAYVSSGGRVLVHNFFSQKTHAVARRQGCPAGRATQVAFAPRGTLLAASIVDGNLLVGDPNRRPMACTGVSAAKGPAPPPRLAWISGRTLVASLFDTVARLEVRGQGVASVASVKAPSGVTALTVSPDRRQIALGLWRGDRLRLVVATMPVSGDRDLRIVRALRSLPDPAAGYTLIWR